MRQRCLLLSFLISILLDILTGEINIWSWNKKERILPLEPSERVQPF